MACSAAKIDRQILRVQTQAVDDLVHSLFGVAVAIAVIQLGDLTAELQGHSPRLATLRLRNGRYGASK